MAYFYAGGTVCPFSWVVAVLFPSPLKNYFGFTHNRFGGVQFCSSGWHSIKKPYTRYIGHRSDSKSCLHSVIRSAPWRDVLVCEGSVVLLLVMCWPVNNALCGFCLVVAGLTVVLTCKRAFMAEIQLALNHGLPAWPISAPLIYAWYKSHRLAAEPEREGGFEQINHGHVHLQHCSRPNLRWEAVTDAH